MSTPVSSQPEYIPVSSEAPEIFYTLDTTGSDATIPESFDCPDQIDDMLSIVRKLRQTRMQNLAASGELAAFDVVSDDGPLDGPVVKSRANNNVFRNAADLYANF
jgi:hypothetical protein